MKMSHEKIVQVSHQVIAAIEALDEVEIYEEPNTIRQQVVKILTDLLHDEEKIDLIVKARIASQNEPYWRAAANGRSCTENTILKNCANWGSPPPQPNPKL